MRFVLYTNSISAHQLPLAREIVKRLGEDNFRYVYAAESEKGNQRIDVNEPWIVKRGLKSKAEVEEWLNNCDVLLVGGIRPIDLMERRLAAGRKTLYMSERWFKPIVIKVEVGGRGRQWRLNLPGWLRLLHPGYFRMACRFARLFCIGEVETRGRGRQRLFLFLPIGPWAARDMRLVQKVMARIGQGRRSRSTKEDESAFLPWGDFVAPSEVAGRGQRSRSTKVSDCLRVLWVGRMLDWKRVDTLIRAVAEANDSGKITLTLVGDGPEKPRLERLARRHLIANSFSFHPSVPIDEVRAIMRAHDVYVLSSNAYEGWGCVVPEALSEGMDVIGTFEAGASAALLPKANLFHCGDWRALARMLREHSYRHVELPYDYTPAGAAERLLSLCAEM